MARTSTVRSAVVVREKFYWPDAQLNVWWIVMAAAAGTILGGNAEFMAQQNQMNLGVPWILPYGITVGTLTIILIIIMLVLIAQRRLLPGVVGIWAFILLVLFLAGVVETAIQLFGPADVNGNCNTYVLSNQPTPAGPTLEMLAWMQQRNICQVWQAVFAFWIIGAVFLIWILVIALQVQRNMYE